MSTVMEVYDLFVSGGKDSVVAATIGYEEAKQKGVTARVVFINEIPAFKVPLEILPFNPLDYVKRFSEWLGVDLVVLEPKIDYWEGVKKWGYPLLLRNRWCYDRLKMKVLKEFVIREVREGYLKRTWVLGIRVNESSNRQRFWGEALRRNRILTLIGDYRVELYLPIANRSEEQVMNFIKERGIPENPAWDYGWSMECLCMAGSTLKTIDTIIVRAPKLALWLAERDREIQQFRSSYPAPLIGKGIKLHEYIERRLKQPRLTQYMDGG